jgi:4-oxalocrotonate tautomerase
MQEGNTVSENRRSKILHGEEVFMVVLRITISIRKGGFMPIIQVHLIKGRTVDQKRKLVTSITDAVVKSLGVKDQDVRIILQDMAKDDYAVAGVLVADKKA